MEAVGMQLPGRRKEAAGEMDSPNLEMNEEEEEEEDEEEEEEEEEEEIRNAGSLDEDEKESDLSDQEMEDLRAQMIQLLEELEEAREMVLKHEDDSLELQGLLEDERLASAQQAEIFTKQIQRLQAQMRSLTDEFDLVQEGKDVELERLEQELQEANEEIHNLRLDAEEAAALHENEIAGLQEELCRLKAELERVQDVRNEYDMEITTLRAEINMKEPGTGDSQPSPEMMVMTHFDDRTASAPSASEEVTRLQEELKTMSTQYQQLSEEYQVLQESNKIMVHQLERLEAMKNSEFPSDRSKSKLDDSPMLYLDSELEGNAERRFSVTRRSSLQLVSSASLKTDLTSTSSGYDEEERNLKLEEDTVLEEESGYEPQTQLREEEQKVELIRAQLQLRLREEEEKVEQIQAQLQSYLREEEQKAELIRAQRDQAQQTMWEMESKYQASHEEWEQLHEELRLCKEEIQRLNGTIPTGGRVPIGGLKPLALFVVLAGGLFLYPCLKRCSSS
ncbi:coiled-coil domain-containing protein 136 isoform X2 [Hemicordylus capensis]|uniref:coiled-coil domain-containing protein 136 isoform X2 n=1 Tax=Hemicordylus capensis TaxID=884348 RepID=UPI00230310A7|nr:coiled-coil domain-containing protein 136 isoform X2 [Hemicordylus capensis]